MNKSTAVIGSILIFFGLFFLLQSLDLIWFDFGDLMDVLFPLALIAFGIWLMRRKKKPGKSTTGQAKASYQFAASATMPHAARPESPMSDPSATIKMQAHFGAIPSPPPRPEGKEEATKETSSSQFGVKIRYQKMIGDMYIDCEGLNLGNVEVSAGIGDVEIKVSGGILGKGLNRMIISGFVGDIRIFVPKDFAFFAHCSNFVGDVEVGGKRVSGFGNTVEHQSVDYDKAESKLYIASNNFIGDMKIYHV